jgi:hypothetical protein
MLRILLSRLAPVFVILFTAGCATDPPRPAPYYPSSQQRCQTPFNSTDSTENLCRWWHTNRFGTWCAANIAAELQRRNVILSPASECGKPQQQTCYISFNSTDPTESLCRWSYDNTFGPACAPSIRSELSRRNVVTSPRAECGRPIGRPQCTLDTSRIATAEICSSYWGNRNLACDGNFIRELNLRGLQTGKNTCGQPITAAQTQRTDNTQPQMAQEALKTCAFSDLGNLTQLSAADLCGSIRGGGQCSSVARTILAGRGLSANPDNSCGTASPECGEHIGKIRADKDPIAKSCDSRFERTADSVRCRVNTVGLLFINARRTGNNRSECGAPLLQVDFERFKALPSGPR